MAGIILAAQHGLEMKNSLKRAEELYVDVNIFDDVNKDKLAKLKQLPTSCWESAEVLNKERQFFEKNGIFPKGTIDRFIRHLKSYNDKKLSEDLYGKNEEIRKLVDEYLHCM